jgi:hypothetical protein
MTRLSVNINDETAANLRRIAVELDTNVTEVVRRSVTTFAYIHDRGAYIVNPCVNYQPPQNCIKLLPNTDDWCGNCRTLGVSS